MGEKGPALPLFGLRFVYSGSGARLIGRVCVFAVAWLVLGQANP